MGRAEISHVLVRAEDRLRARGLTGSQAFDELLLGLRRHLGDEVEAHPELVQLLAELPAEAEVDLLGLAWERFFPDLFKGLRGQFFTPRPLVELILARLGPLEDLDVLDPTCGSGGFLVCAARRGARVRGGEIDPSLAELARINLRLAGVEGRVEQGDFFTREPRPADLVVANPPFSVEIRDPAVLEDYELARGRGRVVSDWLFVEALERWVRPGGRAGIVLPWSILTNQSWKPLRERVDAHWVRLAECALPEGVFRPFGGAAGRAVLLWLQRRPCASAPTSWATLDDPGYDPRSRHLRPTSGAEVEALMEGEGWSELPVGAWTPPGTQTPGRPARELVAPSGRTLRPAGRAEERFVLVDLADTDKDTGEVTRAVEVRGAELKGARVGFEEGDILVSKLRPALGNVVLARRPAGMEGALLGSGEWLPLRAAAHPHAVLLALRTPTWRSQLTLTGGQTRPRTTMQAVLDTRIPLPEDETLVQRLEALAAEIHDERARLRDRLERLQQAVDEFAAGQLDEEALTARLEAMASA